jgi:hypothetical protein
MMQMSEMGDAQVRHLEHEDRVGVEFRAAAPVADVGGYVANMGIADLQVVPGRASGRIPATQDVLDGRIGEARIMGRVGFVHRGDVGRHIGPDVIVVIRRDTDAARAFDQEGCMPYEGQADLAFGQRRRNDERCPRGHEAGARFLARRGLGHDRPDRKREQGDGQGKAALHGPSSALDVPRPKRAAGLARRRVAGVQPPQQRREMVGQRFVQNLGID